MMMHTALNATVKQRYGSNIPPKIGIRLQKELEVIQRNDWGADFHCAYQITQQLRQANLPWIIPGMEGGYSLVAFLLGITHVNPLPSHYYCPKCKRVEFVTEAKDGYDLPESICNACGIVMQADGQQIDLSWLSDSNCAPFHEYRIPACGISLIDGNINKIITATVSLDRLHWLSQKTEIAWNTIPANESLALHSLFLALGDDHIRETNLAHEVELFSSQDDDDKMRHQLRLRFAKEATTFSDLVCFLGMYHAAVDSPEKISYEVRKILCDRDSVLDLLCQSSASKKEAIALTDKICWGLGGNEEVLARLKALRIDPQIIQAISQIGYLFPRAHAVSFGTLYIRLAWFYLHYPEEYAESLKLF